MKVITISYIYLKNSFSFGNSGAKTQARHPSVPVDGILEQGDQIAAIDPDHAAEAGDPPRVPQQRLRGDPGVNGDELQVPAIPRLLEGVGCLQWK